MPTPNTGTDQLNINPATTTLGTIASSSSASVTLAPGNIQRRCIYIANNSSAILYIVYGAGAASSTNFTFAIPGNGGGALTLVEDEWTGPIQGRWASTNGSAYITETQN